MYTTQSFTTPPRNRPFGQRLPFRVLLALPDRWPDRTPLYSALPAALDQVLSNVSPEAASKALRFHVWCPWWDDATLEAFLSPFPHVAAERAPAFPVYDSLGDWSEAYDIVHVISQAVSAAEFEPSFGFAPLSNRAFRAGGIRDLVVEWQTGLLVLQDTYSSTAVRSIADLVVGGGGPSTLAMGPATAQQWQSYLNALYANITHNISLSAATPPVFDVFDVHLALAANGDAALQLDEHTRALHDALSAMLSRYGGTDGRTVLPAGGLGFAKASSEAYRVDYDRFLHARDPVRVRAEALDSERQNVAREITATQHRLAQIPSPRAWRHEADGVVPLGAVTADVEALIAQGQQYRQSLESLDGEMRYAALSAPRVLNANFASGATVVDPARPLAAESTYDLLVDVGPVWNNVPSAIRHPPEFPVFALPAEADQGGYRILVTVVSDDFTPSTVSAALWLPKLTGRSYPMTGDQRANDAGPVLLRLSTPSVKPNETRDARARLFLHYGSNLLQSAVVRATIAEQGVEAPGSVEISIDFTLTETFQALDTRLDTRRTDAEGAALPVAASIALNDDGAYGHRIVVKESTLPPAWAPIDPEAVKGMVARSRKELAACWYQRDDSGATVCDRDNHPIAVVRDDCTKPLADFGYDLAALAQIGQVFYHALIPDVRSEQPDQTAREWVKRLRAALAKRAVIQIARTTPAQYVFPWGLVYDYYLAPGIEPHFCRVLEDWKHGTLDRHPLDECPYAHDADHQENVLCPYGFWGLRHVIEQPLQVYRRPVAGQPPTDDAPVLMIDQSLNLAVGVTRDTGLKPGEITDIDAHVTALGTLPRVHLTARSPAYDATVMRDAMSAATAVYFLCHGEYDGVQQEPYIGVGLRDNSPDHRIYPRNVQAWANSLAPPTWDAWTTQRPVIVINGCHTADLEPGAVLDLVRAFAFAGASAVVGTEVSIQLPLAIRFARELLGLVLSGQGVCKALRTVRWSLAKGGNLLGLAYTAYGMADVRFSAPSTGVATPAAPDMAFPAMYQPHADIASQVQATV